MASELRALAAEMAAAAASVAARAAAVVEKGALNVKNDARANAASSSGKHARQYPGTITYQIAGGGLAADIGPEKHGQGYLGPILEYGSVHNPPHRDLGRALDTEEPRFITAAAELGIPWR